MIRTDRSPLELAVEAGRWLTAMAVEVGEGFRWPVALESPFAETSTAGLATGGAGVGRFLLDLHRETGEASLRDLAVGAARRITAWAPELYEGIGPDLLDGGAGVARFLAALCREGEDLIEEARTLGHWLVERARRLRQTGFGYGRAGIGDLLLDLAAPCGETVFLDEARATARWLDDVAHRPGAGLRAWGAASGVEATDVTWGRGTAGVATFLLNLDAAEGDEEALTAAREALEWLSRTAERPAEDEMCWPSRVQTDPYRLVGVEARCTGPVHGVAGIAEVFLKLWRATGEEAAGRAARMASGWVLSRAEETADGGIRWPHAQEIARYDAGLLGGAAGIGSMLLQMHESFPQAGYAEAAWRAGRHLEAVAEARPEGGLAWWDILETDDPEEKRFRRTSLYGGAAGIGTFFLALHRAQELD